MPHGADHVTWDRAHANRRAHARGHGLIARLIRWAIVAFTSCLALLWFCLGVTIEELRCGDSCAGREPAWASDDRAWQWTAQLGITIVGIGFLALAVRQVLRLRWGRAVLYFAAAVLISVPWFAIARHSSV
jgi:hypothetical protein